MGDRDKFTRVALRTSLFYAFFSALWIVLSGGVLAALVRDPDTAEKLEIYKGWAFVAVTAFLLYGALRRQMQRLEQEAGAREQAEQLMRSSEERFKSYFELGLIGMVLSSPTDTLEVNEEACKMLGYERNELLHMTWAQITHPDDLPANVAYANRLFSGEIDGYSMDKRFIRKDGKLIYATISVKCVRGEDGSVDYIVSLLQDITERKRAEQVLYTTRLQLSEAMDLASIVYWELDWTTETFVFNDAFYAFLGTTAEQEGGYLMAAGDYRKRFIHPDDAPMVAQAAEKIRSGRIPNSSQISSTALSGGTARCVTS